MFGFSVEFWTMTLGGSNILGIFCCEEVVWLQVAPNSQTGFETSGDFGGKFLLILRERIWAYGEGACVGRVLGRSSLLDWG